MMNGRVRILGVAGGLVLAALAATTEAQYQMERLGRGVVAVRTGSNSVFVSWRVFGNDPSGIGFNVYRGTTKVNSAVITGGTNLVDTGATLSSANTYTVRPVVNGTEQAASAGFTLPANAPTQQYLNIPLQRPAGGTTPDNVAYTYSPNDASVGDLDGDGEYEIVLKWDPSNAKDNSQSGYTGNVFLDAYKLNGTRMWRIDLGRNIRAGAHYTQFQVYDYDGDGKAEVMCKTADGTRDNAGTVIGSSSADHRNSSGYVLAGPEFLTVFNGETGRIMATTNYVPARGTVGNWGDTYGNRVDRFLAGTAYLDGQRPSAIFARGYYTRTVIVAWDWRNGQLTQRWVFDSNSAGSTYEGRGNHQLSIGDVDADGRQEIIYGSLGINDNGSVMWATNHHGDALHVGDFIPSRTGLEMFKPSEHTNEVADYMLDARTGSIIWSHASCGCDNGRGVAGDVYAGSSGAEAWSSAVSGLSNTSGGQASSRKPGSTNFLAWWDGDTVRELMDGNHIDKYGTGGDTRLLTADGAASINGTKSNPNLSGDILGDWREEVIFQAGNTALRIYTTTTPTSTRIYTLMHDPMYRVAIAWQNTAYNQPPHPSFFLGDGMATPPTPNIVLVGGTNTPTPTATPTNTATPSTPTPTPRATATPSGGSTTYPAESAVLGGGTTIESNNAGFNGSGFANFPASGGSLQFQNVSGTGGSATLSFRFALGATSARAGLLIVNGASQSITFNPSGAWATWTTVNVTANLNSGGSNTVRLESNGQDLANVDELTVTVSGTPRPTSTPTSTPTPTATPTPTTRPTATPGASVYPVESAVIGGGVTIESNNAGFNGTGFANFPATGGFAEFQNVDGRSGGTQTLRFRFALGATGSRTGQLVVNGSTQNITFNSSGAWTTWVTQDVNVSLNSGTGNTVRLQSNGGDLANIDELQRP